MDDITEMESERVEQKTDKKTETEEQSQDNVVRTDKETETEEQSQDTVMETDNKNPGETVGEEDHVSEHKDPPSPMITEEDISHVSIPEQGVNDDDIPKIDDEKSSQLETSPHLSHPSSVAIDPEEGLNKTTVEDNVERDIGSSDVSSVVLKNDKDSVMVDKDTPVVHDETATVPHSKVSEEKESPHHHADTVIDQDKATEENDMASSGDFNEITVTPDTKISEVKGSPLPHADTVMEQEKPAEEVEHNMASSGNHDEVTVTTDTKVSEGKGSPHRHANTVMEQDEPAEEHNMASSEDHNEVTVTSGIKLSVGQGSPLHHADTVMKQNKAAEEHNMEFSEDHDEMTVTSDARISMEEGSSLHHADTVMEQEKAAEEHNMESSEDHNEITVTTDSKDVEESNDRLDKDESNNINLGDHGSEAVYHDQGTKTEDAKEPDVPVSETQTNPENKPSEPLIETSINMEKEPDMPATEDLTENDQNSDVLLAAEVSGNSDKGLSLLPATQTSSDHNEGVATLEAEHMEDMELDVPDSILVTDASIDPPNINVEAPTNAENKDYSIVLVPEGNDADKENASMRREPAPPCVASSDTKFEMGVSGGLNNGVHQIGQASPGLDRPMSPKRSFLLDDTAEGYESGTEEDQSAFMKELYHFFRERKMDFRPPKFYGEGLNCLKLWRAVIRLGGYDKVTGCKLWRQVGESFRPPKTCTTVSWTFRGFYEKVLLEYERHKVMAGEVQIPLAIEPEPMNIDNQASGSGRARRDAAARAMQGWHSQRLNGNGEVSEDKNLVLHQKREKQIGTSPGLLKRKRLSSTEHVARHAIQVSSPMLDVTVVDVGPPADWVKINVQRTQDCFEVYALVPGLVREEVRVQSDPAGRLVISGEPENPMNPWGATPFKKVVSLPTRIDPHHTSAVVTLNGQLFVRVPLEQSD